MRFVIDEEVFAAKELFSKYTDQIDFIQFSSREKYFDSFSDFDLALDSFPVNSTIPTLEALYNNCPVITLKGEQEYSKIGKSILTTIGHEELISYNKEDFIRNINELLNDKKRLENYHKNLRQDLENSYIMNYKDFTTDLEKLFLNL